MLDDLGAGRPVGTQQFVAVEDLLGRPQTVLDRDSMQRLIAGKRVVPELIQSDFTAANIIQQIAPLLPDGEPRQSMMKELKQLHGLLAIKPAGNTEDGGAIGRVAAIVLDQLGAASTNAAQKTAQL